MKGLYRGSQLKELHEQRWRYFWICPRTGFDCREIDGPALAITRSDRGETRFQMFADVSLAGEFTANVVQCARGMSSDYLLDALLHYAGKDWVNRAKLLDVIREIAWTFGNLSWGGAAGSGNPRFVGRHSR